jgi:exonuclease III
MRIATYNFLHGGSAHRDGHIASLLEATAADIVLCQEARPHDVSSDDTFFWHPVPGHRWGSGILLRGMQAKEIRVLGFEGWVIGAELKGRKKLRILSIHCPAGDGGYVRTMHRLLDTIHPLRDNAHLVIGGDFNVATGYRTKSAQVKFSNGERELLDRITAEFRLMPCWQAAHPEEELAQTLRWSANRATPYHCDGIFVPRSWRARLHSCDVLQSTEWDRLSDHNPVVADVADSTVLAQPDGLS